jgi:putative SOS response-associated peptidase YedK
MHRFHDRMQIILDWRHADAWMAGNDPAPLTKPVPEDVLQECVVSTRVNKAGQGDDDATLIEAAI